MFGENGASCHRLGKRISSMMAMMGISLFLASNLFAQNESIPCESHTTDCATSQVDSTAGEANSSKETVLPASGKASSPPPSSGPLVNIPVNQ